MLYSSECMANYTMAVCIPQPKENFRPEHYYSAFVKTRVKDRITTSLEYILIDYYRSDVL
jgi:hypothetical protein